MNEPLGSGPAVSAERGVLPRHFRATLEEEIGLCPIVHIVGARKCGRTTLLRDIARTGQYVTLDDPRVLAAIERDPRAELRKLRAAAGDGPVIIDEAQRSRGLPEVVERSLHVGYRPGQFVIVAPYNVFTPPFDPDAFPPNVKALTLWPLTTAEAASRGPPQILDWAISAAPDLGDLPAHEPLDRRAYIDLILRGGYPGIRNLALEERQAAYRDHVRAMVEREAADVARIRKTDALARLVDRLAVDTGSELNVAKLQRVVGVQRSTLDRFLEALEGLSLIVKLKALTFLGFGREIRKAKHHFADVGMAAALRRLGPRSLRTGDESAALGALTKSFVFAEILRSAPHQERYFMFRHWRDQRGPEIDLLAELLGGSVAIQVKASTTVGPADFADMDWFATRGPGRARRTTSIVFHFGERPLSFGARRFALPVSCLWGDVAAR